MSQTQLELSPASLHIYRGQRRYLNWIEEFSDNPSSLEEFGTLLTRDWEHSTLCSLHSVCQKLSPWRVSWCVRSTRTWSWRSASLCPFSALTVVFLWPVVYHRYFHWKAKLHWLGPEQEYNSEWCNRRAVAGGVINSWTDSAKWKCSCEWWIAQFGQRSHCKEEIWWNRAD